MKLIFSVAVVLALLAIPALAADPVAGENKASSCRSCHGANGNSPFEGIPSLASQPAEYISIQITFYREKERDLPDMVAAVAHLNDDDINDIAVYFAQQKASDPPSSRDAKRIAAGRALAKKHQCESCHLPNYAGHGQIPRLAAQREDYLVKSMTDFKTGVRTGFDETMNGVLAAVDTDGIAALAHFLSRQK